MNKVQQKIIEAVGLYGKNRIYLSAFSEEHIFDLKVRKKESKAPSSVCSQQKNSLVLAESWFRERGVYLSWGTLGGIVLLSFFLFFHWLYRGFTMSILVLEE